MAIVGMPNRIAEAYKAGRIDNREVESYRTTSPSETRNACEARRGATMTDQAIQWPANSAAAAWVALANQAMQLETHETDFAESKEWAATMLALISERLDNDAFPERRLDALRDRPSRRKLAPRNLRYK